MIVIWFIGLEHEERKTLLSLVPSKGFNPEA
jgi:hypothetical protein